MRAIRAGLDRYLNKENINFSIITDREFKPANEALNAHLVELSREGKISSTKHKTAMIPRDVEILHENKQLGLETPESLLQTAWFNIMLHFGKRGRENMREMTGCRIAMIAGEWFPYDRCDCYDRLDRIEVYLSDRCRCDR